MAIHAPRNHLLAYDIADPQRLTDVHRTVKRWGIPLQYSVFLVLATPAALSDLMAKLKGIIDPRKDDIRIYPLPARLDMTCLGRQGFPNGIQLIAATGVGHGMELLVRHAKRR